MDIDNKYIINIYYVEKIVEMIKEILTKLSYLGSLVDYNLDLGNLVLCFLFQVVLH